MIKPRKIVNFQEYKDKNKNLEKNIKETIDRKDLLKLLTEVVALK